MTRARDPRGARVYQSTHWGLPSRKVIEVEDPDLPDELTAMGVLVELTIAQGRRNMTLEFPRTSILAFDPGPSRYMYVVLTRAMQRVCAANLLSDKADWYDLDDVAQQVGGRQAEWAHPRIPVQIVGIATQVVYATEKKGDGPSLYEHDIGEESGLQPALCCDETGRLWFAGGNYVVEDRGIVD